MGGLRLGQATGLPEWSWADVTTRLWRASLAFDAPPLKGAQSGSPVSITQPAQGNSAPGQPAMTGRPRACSSTSSSPREQASGSITSSGFFGALVIVVAISPSPSNIFFALPGTTKHCCRLRQAVAVSPPAPFVYVATASRGRSRETWRLRLSAATRLQQIECTRYTATCLLLLLLCAL